MTAQPLVGIIMGSDSDWPVMREAAAICERFGVAYEARVVSVHRTPRDVMEYAEGAAGRGLLAIRILAAHDPALQARMAAYQEELAAMSRAKTVGGGQ